MKRLSLPLVALSFMGWFGAATAGQAAGDPAAMIAVWDRLNSQCRGGSGDDPKTLKACEKRDALYGYIEAAGFCYGENAQYGYQMRWDICNKRR